MHFIPIFLVLGILWLALDAYAKSTGKKITRVRRIDPATGKETIEVHETITTGGMKSVAGQAAGFLKSCLVLMILSAIAIAAIVVIATIVGNK